MQMKPSEFLSLITTISIVALTIKFPCEVLMVLVGLGAIGAASIFLICLFAKLTEIYDRFL